MSQVERSVVAGLPWLAGIGAAAMAGVAAAKWRDLSVVDRSAFGIDALAYAVAAGPLSRRRASGWWALYVATIVQPVLSGIEAGQDPRARRSAIGRSMGAGFAAAALLRIRGHYA